MGKSKKDIDPAAARQMPSRLAKDKPLTVKQQLFVDEYIRTSGNRVAALDAAGYAHHGRTADIAASVMSRSNVQQALQTQKQAVFEGFVKQPQTVMLDLEATRLAALENGLLAVAARCSELQGKHLKMFIDISHHTQEVFFSELSDTERSHRIAALLESAGARRAGQVIDGEARAVVAATRPPDSGSKH